MAEIDLTLVNIEELPAGNPTLSNKIMFGIGAILHTASLTQIKELIEQNLPDSFTKIKQVNIFPHPEFNTEFAEDEFVAVKNAINYSLANFYAGEITTEEGEALTFRVLESSYFEPEPGILIPQILWRYYTLTTGVTTFTGINDQIEDIRPDGVVFTKPDDFINLGDIDDATIEAAFNDSGDAPFSVSQSTFIQATQDNILRVWKWIGGTGQYGGVGTPAVAQDFVLLSNTFSTSIPYKIARTETGATYTFDSTDINRTVIFTNAVTVTIPNSVFVDEATIRQQAWFNFKSTGTINYPTTDGVSTLEVTAGALVYVERREISNEWIVVQTDGQSQLVEQATDSYVGLRLKPKNTSVNGFLVDRDSNTRNGFEAVNTNAGDYATTSFVARGSANLYEKLISMQWFSSGYNQTYLRDKGAIYSTDDIFYLNQKASTGASHEFRTGTTFGGMTKRFKIWYNGALEMFSGTLASITNAANNFLAMDENNRLHTYFSAAWQKVLHLTDLVDAPTEPITSLLGVNDDGEVVQQPYTQLQKAYTESLPIVALTPPSEFNDQLNLNRYYDGNKVIYLQDPYNKIDFELDPAISNTQYYVDYVSGNNANDGLSEGTAWKTLAYAVANASQPAVINLMDEWIGWLNMPTAVMSLTGLYKFKSIHPSGRTRITGMRESYTKATFNWNDEGGGVWSTSEATTTSAIFSALGVAVFDANFTDELGGAMPVPDVGSQANCAATPGSQYHDAVNKVKYVHLIDGREPDPYDGFIYSIQAYNWRITQVSDTGVVLIENLEFYNNAGVAPLASCRYRHDTTDENNSIYGVKNCLAYGSSSNGFETYDAKIIVYKNCHSRYQRRDGFNTHSFKTDGTKGEYMTAYELDCSAAFQGYEGFTNQPALGDSENATSVHNSMHCERINGNYGEGRGATVADVNGCVSVLWNCKAGASNGGDFKSCFWNEKYLSAGTNNGMWLWGCSAHDNDDDTVRLINNEAQSGGSANDGQAYVKFWRGKTKGTVTGTLKDWDGNDI